jgi:hypothetical protein
MPAVDILNVLATVSTCSDFSTVPVQACMCRDIGISIVFAFDFRRIFGHVGIFWLFANQNRRLVGLAVEFDPHVQLFLAVS